jgi:uncharacterized membrane protein YhaH (DUF805 family)
MLPRWVVLSLSSAVGYGTGAVTTTSATGSNGISGTAFTSCVHAIAALLFALTIFLPLPAHLSKNALRDAKVAFTTRSPMAALIAFVFWIGDAALDTAYAKAPNPGYCDSISDLESVLGAVIALVVFGAPVTKRQAVGMLIAVFSLYFLQS